jgi:hypothetical protein
MVTTAMPTPSFLRTVRCFYVTRATVVIVAMQDLCDLGSVRPDDGVDDIFG